MFLAAKRQETQKRTEAIETLTKTYTDTLGRIDADIKEIDDRMAKAPWKGSFDWDKYAFIREARAKDRALILEKLGSQIVDLKRSDK